MPDPTRPVEEIPWAFDRLGGLPFLEAMGRAAGASLAPYRWGTWDPFARLPQVTPWGVGRSGGTPGQLAQPSGPLPPAGSPSGGVMSWAPVIREASAQLGVPEAVIAAIMSIESGGRADAVSPAGAVGLMQVMPSYHAHRAQKYGGPLTDPRVNVLVGAEILKENYDRIKARNPALSEIDAWTMAAAAYFGAFDWQNLRVTGARDAIGTSGNQYADLFRQRYATYAQAFSQPAGQSLGTSASGRMGVASVTGGQSFRLTQGYGQTEFARASGMYRNNSHPGIDLGAPSGTPVTAPLSGTVVAAGDAGDGYGIKVVLQLDNGYRILLGHLSAVAVRPGQTVSAGAVLGRSGNTGASTGPHIHLGVIDPAGRYVDPAVLFAY